MKGLFITPEGKTVTVLEYDDVNKMVYINVYGGQFTWIHENEYSKWTKVDVEKIENVDVPFPIDDIHTPEEPVEEKVKKKPSKKDKNAATS